MKLNDLLSIAYLEMKVKISYQNQTYYSTVDKVLLDIENEHTIYNEMALSGVVTYFNAINTLELYIVVEEA